MEYKQSSKKSFNIFDLNDVAICHIIFAKRLLWEKPI